MRKLSILALLALGACGGDDNAAPGGSSGADASTETSAQSCIPGQSIACVAPGGCQGGQKCKSDGSGYEDCVCASTGGDSSTMSEGSVANDSAASDGTNAADSTACTLTTASPTGRYVADKITLPQSATQFAFDVNGDGKLDNRFGTIIQTFVQQGFDLQGAMNAALAAGQMILLVDEITTDATFTAASCATSEVGRAKHQASAVLDGGGSFVIDPTAGGSVLLGSIAASVLQADIGHPATVPLSVRMVLPFGTPQVLVDGGTVPLPEVPVTPVHITFKYNPTTGLTEGQLNGFITDSDIQTKLLPSIAVNLSASVAANPTSATSKQMLQLFDTGGDGNCATANDGIISTCELATNAIIKNIFLPDVQMFSHGDAASVYEPSVTNMQKDSLSIGLGFTAVPATY